MTEIIQFYPVEVKVEMSTKSFIFERGGLFLIYGDSKFYNSGNVKLICHPDFTVTKNVDQIPFESESGSKISLPIVNFNLSNSNFREKAKNFLDLISMEETNSTVEAKKAYVEEICNESLIELSLQTGNKEMFYFLTNKKNKA